MVKGCIILLYTLLPLISNSQTENNNPIRLELESDKDWYDYSYLPIGQYGILVITREKLIHQDTALWNFTIYDTNLMKIKKFEVKLLSNLLLTSTHFSGSGFYLLFQTSTTRKTTPRWFLIQENLQVTLPQNLSFNPLEIFPELNTVQQMSALGLRLFLFSSEEENNAICFYDVQTNKISHKELLGNSYTESFIIDTSLQKLFITINNYNKPIERLNKGFLLFESSFSGQNGTYTKFPEYDSYQFKSARMAKTDSASYIIIGSYNNATEKKPSNLHSGVYTLTYKNGIMGYPNFFNYTSLKTKDTKEQIKAQSNAINLNLVIGDLYTNNQQYGFVTEVYYPEYSTTNYYAPGSYYVSTPVSTFEGYRFLNAYITTFDKEGNLLWDNYMPINDMLTQTLYAKVGLYLDNQNNGYIYYPNNSTITSTLVNSYTVLEPLMTEKLGTAHAKDNIEASGHVRVERWFGSNFLVTGYQVVKNPLYGKNGKRSIFFINRLQYR